MESLSDLSKYHELRKRIIRNEDLSDNEWELFFELEMKNREMKKQKETWDNMFLHSVLIRNDKKSSIKYNFSFKEVFSVLRSALAGEYQYAYAGLLIFFLIGFLTYSSLKRQTGEPNAVLGAAGDGINKEKVLSPAVEKKSEVKKTSADLLAYAENPYLENYISDVVRSVANNLELTSPQPSLRFKLKDGKDSSAIHFSGILPQESPIGSVCLKIFSNKNDDYSSDTPLLKEELEFRLVNAKWVFSKDIKYPLRKGLYYFSVEGTKNGEILYLNKFYIY